MGIRNKHHNLTHSSDVEYDSTDRFADDREEKRELKAALERGGEFGATAKERSSAAMARYSSHRREV